jgi:hypothetical protein
VKLKRKWADEGVLIGVNKFLFFTNKVCGI